MSNVCFFFLSCLREPVGQPNPNGNEPQIVVGLNGKLLGGNVLM